MSPYHLILREGFLDTVPCTVAGPGDGLVEAGQLAKVLQVPVHQLIGKYRQRPATRELLVFVLIQDGLGKTIQVDGQPVIGLDRSNVHCIALDVRALKVGQVRVTERGEGTEAETVPGLDKTAGILHLLRVLLPVHIGQLHLGAVSGHLKMVQVQQFFLGQEDDGLLQHLELGPVALDRVLLSVSLTQRPVQEPAEIVEVLLDTLLLQALIPEEDHPLVDAGLVEVLELHVRVELLHMVRERLPYLQGGIGPAVGCALLVLEFFQAVEEADTLDSRRVHLLRRFLLHRPLEFLLDIVRGWLVIQLEFPLGEVGPDLVQDRIDILARLSLGVLVILGRLPPSPVVLLLLGLVRPPQFASLIVIPVVVISFTPLMEKDARIAHSPVRMLGRFSK